MEDNLRLKSKSKQAKYRYLCSHYVFSITKYCFFFFFIEYIPITPIIYVFVSCDRLSEEIRQVFSNVKNQPKHKDFHSKSL